MHTQITLIGTGKVAKRDDVRPGAETVIFNLKESPRVHGHAKREKRWPFSLLTTKLSRKGEGRYTLHSTLFYILHITSTVKVKVEVVENERREKRE